MDIADFFKKSKNPPNPKARAGLKHKGRVIESDSDDDIQVLNKKSQPVKKRKIEELKPLDASEYFNSRSKKSTDSTQLTKSTKQSSKQSKYNTHDKKVNHNNGEDDDLFEDLDDSDLEMIDRVEKVSRPSKRKADTYPPATKSKSANSTKSVSRLTAKKSSNANTSTSSTTAEQVLAKIPDAELPSDVEKQAFNFAAMKSRHDSDAASGSSIELPQCAPNCLAGLTIVFTGTLPNLSRPDCEQVAKNYGAKVTKSVSGKTTLVVLGEEAGWKKIETIKKFNIKAINEDGFIQLLKEMPVNGGSGVEAHKFMEKQKKQDEEINQMVKEMEKEEEISKIKKKRETQSVPSSISPSSFKPEPLKHDTSAQLWTTKYAPKTLKEICGNSGMIAKLQRWLQDWDSMARKNFPAGEFRAVLISGPPGIGKTTTAHLVARQMGYDVLEQNASDVRSKNLLNDRIKAVLSNTPLAGYFTKKSHSATNSVNSSKFVIIMDEVDGMSSGDHGGVGQLAAFCRTTKVPIICICNERSLPKMKPFDRTTLDLSFRRPTETQVMQRVTAICRKENIQIDPSVVGNLIQSTHGDMRQILNFLSTISLTQKNMSLGNTSKNLKAWEKHVILKPWDIVSRLFSSQTWSHSNLNEKIELYFNDFQFVPLMVQENYLTTRPSGITGNSKTSNLNHLLRLAEAADSISYGDLVDRGIHGSEQQWSLMPFHAVMSTVRPASFVAGQATGRYNFTSWLGQNSKTNKYRRLLQEVEYHSRLRISGDKHEIRLQYIPFLSQKLIKPLKLNGVDGIPEVISVLDEYYLTKEDWDTIMDFGVGNHKSEIVTKCLTTQIKSSFTRQYNAGSHPTVIFNPGTSIGGGKAKKEVPDIEDAIEDDEDVPDEKEEDTEDITKDKSIKKGRAKKTKAKATGKGSTKARATGTKAKPRAKPKGRAKTK